ncbi:MAG: hypothetical protein WAM39_10720, partial [Bryobacteraceae bacterium]
GLSGGRCGIASLVPKDRCAWNMRGLRMVQAEDLALGADLVLTTEEEDVTRGQKLTGGSGTHHH